MILELYNFEAFVEEALRKEVKEVRLASVTWQHGREIPWTTMEIRVTFPQNGNLVRYRAGSLTEISVREEELKKKTETLLSWAEDLTKKLEEKGLEVFEGEWKPDKEELP